MKKAEVVNEILKRMDDRYTTEYTCYLDHENAWELLVATILSAQCTDKRVNMVTKDLFKKYPNPESFAKADLKELEKDIHSRLLSQQGKKHYSLCKSGIGKTWRRSAKNNRRVNSPSRSRKKNSQCNQGKYIQRSKHCG